VPYLTILTEDGRGEGEPTSIPPDGPFTVGRGAGSSLRIRDLKMSRIHFEISSSRGSTVITDLGSMNGTLVNCKLIASVELKDGDVIQAGYTRLRFHAGEPGDRRAPVHREKPPAPAGANPGHPAPPPADAPQAFLEEVRLLEEPSGPSDEEIAAARRIVFEGAGRALKRGEKVCCSCRRPVAGKDLKAGKATDVHGQVCCPLCIEQDPLLGKTVAGYRIDAKLGAGAWSSTYNAHQLSMARAVVFRVVNTRVIGDREVMTQFLAGVKSGGQISHPNLVRIYDIGRAEGLCYISTEYIDGASAQQRLGEKPPFTVAAVAQIIAEVGGAVDVAHRRGVLHRDIRPANIILNEEGIPKLAGLGLVASIEDAAVAGVVDVRHGVETVLYWAPECLAAPAAADKASDVYSLGAVAYAMLAGKPPFEPADPARLVGAMRRDTPPPLNALRKEVLLAVSNVVARAMAKAPAERYAGCQEFARDLAAAAR